MLKVLKDFQPRKLENSELHAVMRQYLVAVEALRTTFPFLSALIDQAYRELEDLALALNRAQGSEITGEIAGMDTNREGLFQLIKDNVANESSIMVSPQRQAAASKLYTIFTSIGGQFSSENNTEQTSELHRLFTALEQEEAATALKTLGLINSLNLLKKVQGEYEQLLKLRADDSLAQQEIPRLWAIRRRLYYLMDRLHDDVDFLVWNAPEQYGDLGRTIDAITAPVMAQVRARETRQADDTPESGMAS